MSTPSGVKSYVRRDCINPNSCVTTHWWHSLLDTPLCRVHLCLLICFTEDMISMRGVQLGWGNYHGSANRPIEIGPKQFFGNASDKRYGSCFCERTQAWRSCLRISAWCIDIIDWEISYRRAWWCKAAMIFKKTCIQHARKFHEGRVIN